MVRRGHDGGRSVSTWLGAWLVVLGSLVWLVSVLVEMALIPASLLLVLVLWKRRGAFPLATVGENLIDRGLLMIGGAA